MSREKLACHTTISHWKERVCSLGGTQQILGQHSHLDFYFVLPMLTSTLFCRWVKVDLARQVKVYITILEYGHTRTICRDFLKMEQKSMLNRFCRVLCRRMSTN